MKIITLMSSYRKNGNTARLVQIIEDQLRTIGAQMNIQVDTEMVFLGHSVLQTCRGCQGKISRIAERIVNGVELNSFLNPTFLSLLFFMVQQRNFINKQADDSIDYSYWKGKGWLDPSCHYHIKHQANPLKIIIAQCLAWIIAKFVLK